jgi:hypothetical protein
MSSTSEDGHGRGGGLVGGEVETSRSTRYKESAVETEEEEKRESGRKAVAL